MLDPLGQELQIVRILELNLGPLEEWPVPLTMESYRDPIKLGISYGSTRRSGCNAVKVDEEKRRVSERLREQEVPATLNLRGRD